MPAVKYSNRTIKSNLPSCFWEALKEVPRKPKEIQQKKRIRKTEGKTIKKKLVQENFPNEQFFFLSVPLVPSKSKTEIE